MIQIKEFVNSIFTSKTYILYREGKDVAWLVDIGDVAPVVSFLKAKGLIVRGVFLTHAHFDHIYGLEDLIKFFPDCKVYCTKYAKEALASDKLNMSKYHGTPIIYQKGNVVVAHEGDQMTLFEDEPQMEFYETPGHNPGCLTMVMGDLIFTGDAYIPGVGANTQLPYSDKQLAKQSLDRILNLTIGRRLYPGHCTNESNIEF